MTRNRRWAVYAGSVLAGLAVSAPAHAASSGVHVDPNSPAGKEYAIPLQTARSQGNAPTPSTHGATSASPGDQGQSSPGASRSAADNGLFGAGISRPTPRTHRTRTATRRVAATAVQAPAVFPAADRRTASSGGGGSAGIFWVGAALAVLIPGLAVGIGVRRWRQA